MKKLLPHLVLLLVPLALNAQIVNIPDVNFKNALVNEAVAIVNGSIGLQDVDTNNDGEIQLSEALAVTELQVQTRNINSMEGLQSFENLVRLLCFNNNLTEIDLSQNVLLTELLVNQNNLTSLDVTDLADLEWLSSSDNLLKSLDVSQNPDLRIFRTSRNQITEMDVSNNVLLEQFWCSNNQVSTLDISNNPAITNFTGKGNPLLTSLNVQNGNNSNMTRMWGQENPNLNCILVDDENASYPTCNIGGNTGWCKDSNTIYSENPSLCNLSIAENKDQLFAIIPNPASEVFEIVSLEGVKSVEVYTVSGQLVMEVDQPVIDISNLPTGIFVVAIQSFNNRNIYKKLIKSN